MKTLYLDIFSGISGDMFLGAMIDLGVDLHRLEHELEKLGLEGYHLHVTRGQKSNIEGVKFDVHLAHDETEHHSHHDHHDHGQDHSHEHDHGHGDHHHDHLAGASHGPHGGPLIQTSLGRVEISVFETGVAPRFRVYFFDAHGHAVAPPAAAAVHLETFRGRKKQRRTFRFRAQRDFLEATAQLPEPHEFLAVLKLRRGRKTERHEVQFVGAHHHHGEESHSHHGRNFAGIRGMIQQSSLSRWVKEKSIAVFRRVAVAEGKIHGHAPDEVHFHEVGAVDSIVDIVGACIALEMLGKPRVLAAPVVEGTGWVNCAHGRFPVPTTGTLEILGARGIALTQCDEPHELVTPTGAALLAEFAESFEPMRGLAADRIGYGLGTRDNKTRPNVLRAVLGELRPGAPEAAGSSRVRNDWETDTVAVLETNLDDCTAEVLGHVVERALSEGALDVFHTAVQMKKNRPGVLLSVLCSAADADRFTELLLRETSAFGVRRQLAERRKLKRESVSVKTRWGEIKVKIGFLNGKVVHVAPEYESCKQVALENRVNLAVVYHAARIAFVRKKRR